MEKLQLINLRQLKMQFTPVKENKKGRYQIKNKYINNSKNLNHLIMKNLGPTYLLLSTIIYIMVILMRVNARNNNNRKLSFSHDNTIKLMINGNGWQYILNPNYNHCPYAIYVNNKIDNNLMGQDDCRLIYISPEEGTNNQIQLIWNSVLYDLSFMFKDLLNLTEVDLSEFDSSNIYYTNIMFSGCQSLTYINFDNFNTPKLIDVQGMFYNCISLQMLDLSFFDTSQVTNMSCLFYGCYELVSVNLASFNTSEVRSMSYMFFSCYNLGSLDLINFKTSKVIEMKFMFYDCESLVNLDLSKFNTPSLIDISAMFYANIHLENLNIMNFDTSRITLMNHTFQHCWSLTHLNILNFDTSQVINMDYMFYDCRNLLYLDLSNFRTQNVISMIWMFRECYNLVSLNINNFTTEKITIMSALFYFCQRLEYLDLSSFNTSNVLYMDYMFCHCNSLTSINLKSFDTEKVLTMEAMFANCLKLPSIDVSNFNTISVYDLNYMFYNCTIISTLNLSNFYTPYLETISHMFYQCVNLISLDISNLDTSQTIDMQQAFYGCLKLQSLNISNLDTSKVIYMNQTFEYCTSLKNLDISNFNTSSVLYMDRMFTNCISLVSINLPKFITQSIIKIDYMFFNCISLEYINFPLYNEPENLLGIINILYKVPENIVICLNINNTIDKLMYEINSKICPIIYCGDDWKSHQKKIINNSCEENNFEQIESTFKELIYTTFVKTTNIILTTELPEQFVSTIDFQTTFVPDKGTIGITNIKTTELYDKNIISENPEFSTNEIFISTIINNPTSSLTKNDESIYSTFLSSSLKETESLKIFVTDKSEISTTQNFNLEEKKTTSIKEIKIDYFENSNYTSEEINQKIYEQIINNVIQNFEDSNEEGVIIEAKDNFFYQITTLENDLNTIEGNNNATNRFSRIDIGECENVLRESYNLDKNVSLIIVKFEKISNFSYERNLQFEIYESLRMTRLNLSLCNDIPIDIHVPVILSEKMQNLFEELKDLGYDLFDINNEFYQDICTPYKSSNGTDVLLSDRINFYFNNDETQC